MKTIKAAFLCFSLAVSFASSSNAEGWRGIIPLRSTQADVERVLGKFVRERNCAYSVCSYYLDDVNVFVVYSSGDCKSEKPSGWNVPPNTVIRFSVYPKIKQRLSELKVDLKKYEKRQDPEIKNNVDYVDDEEGLIISVNVETDVVQAFYYEPAAKDQHLRCPEVKTPKEVFRQKRLEEILISQKPQNSDFGITRTRDTFRYKAAGTYKLEVEYDEEETLKNRATIRQFLWEHWRQQRLGYLELILFTAIRGVSHRSVFIEPDEKGVWQIVVERSIVVDPDKSIKQSVVYVPPQITFDVVERIEPTEDGTSPIVLIPENKRLKPNEYMLRLRNSRTGEEAIW